MPFYFRKSVRLGSGMRMNLSKSGVGFSVGAKGCRVSTGPRGTYVSVGAGGIYYRQKIGGAYGQAANPPPPPQPSYSYASGTPIPTASADQLVDSTSAAMLERLNFTIKQPAYAWMFVAGGAILSLVFANLHPIFFVLLLAFGVYLASIANQRDKERRTYNLEYNLDDTARVRWVAMNTALAALTKTQAFWRITTLDHTYDWKRNAGANSLLSRVHASLTQQPAFLIASNLTPYSLHIGSQRIYFFPDRTYIYEHGVYGAVEYNSLGINTGQTNFIENEGVPSDAQVVGSTWQYVNKSGGPDRRFNNNRQIPIVNYGVVELQSSTGLNILLHVSSLNAAYEFGTLYQQSMTIPAQPKQTHAPQPPRNSQQQQRRSTSPTPPPIADCYQVLGLTPSCTKEEASVQYRKLASSYHPDRVNHLAPEFKALAHKKMTEINNAVAELKRLRGW